jgi:hypothetical protein
VLFALKNLLSMEQLRIRTSSSRVEKHAIAICSNSGNCSGSYV